MNSIFGLETEYGIAVEGAGADELVAASREVVKSFRGRFASPWNYRSESPRHDVRGFDVERLSQDETDSSFDRASDRASSPSEDRCDRVLTNGARLYNDHGHPEYATPECTDLRALVAHDKAGERIVLECARAYAEAIGKHVGIFKNNTDFHGASYGTHESYLLRRGVEWEDMVPSMAAFLATRIIFCGAGKVGCEERGAAHVDYQLSQRADFFSVLQSVDTLANRPLVNTRDEPHGEAKNFRRWHVISGDANMSEYATALKVGSANLVAALLKTGWQSPVVLRDAVRAIKQISRDESQKWMVEDEDGNWISAIDVQRCFLRGAQELQLPASEWILAEWEATLNGLESNPMDLRDRLDWVAKFALLHEFADAENLDWKKDQHTLQSLDLAYHDVDPEAGLYHGLTQNDLMVRLVEEEEIIAAQTTPPVGTRATLRGVLVEKFAEQITSVSWGEVHGHRCALRLPQASSSGLPERISNAASLREAGDLLK